MPPKNTFQELIGKEIDMHVASDDESDDDDDLTQWTRHVRELGGRVAGRVWAGQFRMNYMVFIYVSRHLKFLELKLANAKKENIWHAWCLPRTIITAWILSLCGVRNGIPLNTVVVPGSRVPILWCCGCPNAKAGTSTICMDQHQQLRVCTLVPGTPTSLLRPTIALIYCIFWAG